MSAGSDLKKKRSYSAADIFAGCGGLSVGLNRSGFSVVSAVEIEPRAAAVYVANHQATKFLNQDVRLTTAQDLAVAGGIDLLAGCAPCQGFCSLTSKYARDDPRNELLLEMARLVEQVEPRAVLMENVPGVLDRGREIFQSFLRRLRAAGYYVQYGVLQMADFGVPQQRRRLVLVAGRGFAIPIPSPTHSRTPEENGLKPWRTVRDAIGNRRAPLKLADAMRQGGPAKNAWHVVRDLRPETRARLRAAMPGKARFEMAQALRPNCHKGDYKGFSNVYGRMRWDMPSPTITAGCTTPCKGRFGHPDRRRTTISVREAALLQTFPARYRFPLKHMDRVCEMIGNAVPPVFAGILGATVHASLSAHDAALASISSIR